MFRTEPTSSFLTVDKPMLWSNVQRPHCTCTHCNRTFQNPGGVRRHIAHSMECCEQLQIQVQQAQPTSGDQDQDMEYDVWRANDLPAKDCILAEHSEDAHYSSNKDHTLAEHGEDTHAPAERGEDAHEPLEEHKKGDEPLFSCFAEEFSINAAADVLGIDATPFKHMMKHQEESGEGTYAPFAGREEWELAQ
jgi:hypothetical protein